ncbi:MAG: TonB-dependent receptor, partial [Sphingomonas sp.]|nr:TonB-dependent receptor [Sphingomonas sp.]
MNVLILPAAALAAMSSSPDSAQAVTGQSTTDASGGGTPGQETPPSPTAIVVTGRRLDVARDAITPSLGASQYTFDREALNKQPGGTNLTLNKSLLQAPGVVQDSYGVIHVRNEHANLQYRLNGVIVPESISGFGTTFDPRIASSIQLITGTLPAQYGYRTAGVVNFKTESGLLGNRGEAGIYGGSFGWLEPSAMIQGSSGNFSYFLSGSYLRNDIGIENPLPTKHAIHDRTIQIRPFAFVSDVLSEKSRVALFAGSFIGKFQIPNVTGVSRGYYVNGNDVVDAAKLDQNQREITNYAVGTYQYAGDRLNFQIAPFVRYSQTRFTPDPNHGDIIANGFADAARLSSLAAGVQADGSEHIGNTHTLRFGLFFQNEHTNSRVASTVLPINVDCTVVTDCALSTITDQGRKTGQLYGVYVQDEWKLTPKLTL